MNKPKWPMGSVIHGTMRYEELVPEFARELLRNARVGSNVGRVTAGKRREHRSLVREIEIRMEEVDYYKSGGKCCKDWIYLGDALHEYCAPYFYFGAHPGDGSDYGYWLNETWEEEFDGIKVKGTEEIPEDYVGEVAVVNDHGNVTLYNRGNNHHLYEIWSVV